MKKYTSFIIFAVAVAFILLPSLFAVADTITLKSSVQIQGKIEKEVGEFMHVRVGDRSIRVRKDEIAEVEKNDLDGSYDLEAAKTAAQEEDRKLTETLGLNEEQRDTVYRYISLLNNPDVSKSRDARAALVKMQSDLNIVPYIVFLLPSYLPPVVLSVLELITEISPDQAKEVLREYAFFTDENVRAKALEMLGVIRDKSSAELMMRGLLDHTGIVKIGACYQFFQFFTVCIFVTVIYFVSLNNSDFLLFSERIRQKFNTFYLIDIKHSAFVKPFFIGKRNFFYVFCQINLIQPKML